MKTPVHIFDEWIASNVGTPSEMPPRLISIPADLAFPFKDQLDVFKKRMAEIRPHFLPKKNIEIYADFLDSRICNAAAGFHGSMGLIGITKGCILIPLDLFYRMFCHPLVMRGIGNSQGERLSAGHREAIPDNYDELVLSRVKAKRPILHRQPFDSMRHAVAIACADIAWGFVVLHELTHILHGHVHYLQQVRNITSLLEITNTRNVRTLSRDDLDYQNVEFWADNKAVAIGLSGLLTRSYGPAIQSIFPNAEDKLFLWSFAIFTLFRIWGLEIDPNKLNNRSHPPTLLRFHVVVVGAKEVVSKCAPEISESQFYETIIAGLREAEKAIAYCGEPAFPESEILTAIDPRVADHLKALGDHFEHKLFAALKPLTYIDIGQFPQ